jgi:signal transduction histidine kinase
MKPYTLFVVIAFALFNSMCRLSAQEGPEVIRIDTSRIYQDSIRPFQYYVGDKADTWEPMKHDTFNWETLSNSLVGLPSYTGRWLRIALHNPYEIDVPLQLDVHSIEIYRLLWIETSGGIELMRKETGCSYPIAARASRRASLNTNFILPQGATRVYYLFIQSGWTPIQSKVHIVNFWYSDWHNMKIKDRMDVGFVVGMAVLLALIGLLLCIFFPHIVLLWYAIYIVSGAMYLIASFGMGSEWLWGAYPYFEEMSAELFGALSLTGFTMMARQVYRTQQEYRAVDYYLLGMVAIGMLFLLSACFRFALPYQLVNGMMLASAVVTLPGLILIGAIGALRWFRHGERAQKWFFAMFLYGMFFAAVTLLTSFGWMPINAWTTAYLPYISVIIEGIMATLYIAVFLQRQIQHAQQEKLRIQLQREQEFREISLGLHDEVGSMLSSAVLLSDMAGRRFEEAEHKERMNVISGRLREVYNALRDLAWLWNPDQERLPQALGRLRVFAEEIFDTAAARLHFYVDPAAETLPVSPLQCRNIYFLAKEAVNNAAKYSHAGEVWISVRNINNKLHLEIRDNGRGFDPAAAKQGNGLHSMRARAERLGGTLTIESAPEEGTRICFVQGNNSPHPTI